MFDIQEIMDLLPHRYPMLLVDRVVEYQEGERIVAIKNVTFNEPFFQGHFSGAPIMPGVLIIESMAQAGGFLVFKSLPDRESKLVFLMGRFRRPVRPGDQLRLEMVVIRVRGRAGKLRGQAFVGDQRAAEAQILFSLVDRSSVVSGRD